MADPAIWQSWFAVDSRGVCVFLSITHRQSAAYDILTDAGFPPAAAADLAVRSGKLGYDEEAFARHVVQLRQAARG